MVTAAVEGWEYTISREALLLADLYDLQVKSVSDPKKPKPKPHPMRPFKPLAQRTVSKPTVSQEVVLAALRRSGHTAPVPLA